MKKLLILGFTFVCVLKALGQQNSVDTKDARVEFIIKKQIICHDLERQVKDIPLAAVRVFARYKIAVWLWKDGKDDTGRAEPIAISAIDDLYENKAEIPNVYFDALRPDLFVLLDRNAKNAANKLREKYKIGSDGELDLFDSLLSQKAGEKLAVDAAIKSLVNTSETNPEITFLLARLQQRQSPELFRLLVAIIGAEEIGQTRFTADTLFLMSGYFVESSVSAELQIRFLRLVIDKSRRASVIPEGDVEGFFNLLSGLIATISTKFPDLLSEASVVQTVLKTRVSQELRETQERNDRIRNSTDKLSALISEAEQTSNRAVKYDLYVNAAQLALKLKKFNYSVDIVEKTVAIDLPSSIISEAFRKQWRDQFMGQVVTAALAANDPDSANYATIVDPLSRAEGLRKTANYYFDHSDPVSAHYALDEAIKLITKVEGGDQKIFSLIKLLPTAQKIDRNQVSDIGELTAKSINSIPSLNVEDKPPTENYKNYVTSVMNINWNLLPALIKLLKENRSEAENLVGRINKKEIRIIADYALLTDSIAQDTKSEKEKNKLRN
jgi:hypothetical protein